MKTKRFLTALLSATMVLSMSGCGNSANTESSSDTITQNTEESKAETTLAAETTAESKAETTAAETTATAETQKPDAPTLKSAKAVGNKIQIKFTLPKNISGYRVAWGTEEQFKNKTFKYGDITSTSDTQQVINNLEYGTEYGVAMCSYIVVNGEKIFSETSNSVAVTTGKKPAQTQKNTTADSSTIDPTFKETMDSCEKFFTQYVEFMEKYNNATATDLMSMMTDYSNFLTQYSEFMNKLNSIDKNSLNAAELAYYTKVMAHITAKLAEIGQ